MATAKLLSLQGGIIPTHGAMLSVHKDENEITYKPIKIRTPTILGTESQSVKKGEPARTGNPQKIDTASLPLDSDTLSILFNLTFTGRFLNPEMCDNAEVAKAIRVHVEQIRENTDATKELARRYAANIFAARWAWKNRMLAHKATVQVDIMNYNLDEPCVKSLNEDALSINLTTLETDSAQVGVLADAIHDAITSDDGILCLRIKALLVMGFGQKIFPSQEFTESDNKTQGKVLFSVEHENKMTAGLHDVKLGNAVRTVDKEHGGSEGSGVGANEFIAVEPNGTIVRRSAIVRHENGNKIYKFLGANKPVPAEQHIYYYASLLRGGVLGS